jgi:hypothetical protein
MLLKDISPTLSSHTMGIASLSIDLVLGTSLAYLVK